MSVTQMALPDFLSHAADALQTVEEDHVCMELMRDGKIVAYVSPAPQQEKKTGTLGDWMGSGIGSVSFAPGVDPDEPAFAPEEWEEFPHDSDD